MATTSAGQKNREADQTLTRAPLKALFLSEQALDQAREIGDPGDLAESYLNLGRSRLYLGRFESGPGKPYPEPGVEPGCKEPPRPRADCGDRIRR